MIVCNELSDQAILVALIRVSRATAYLMPEIMALLGTTAAEKEIVVDLVLGGGSCAIENGCRGMSSHSDSRCGG